MLCLSRNSKVVYVLLLLLLYLMLTKCKKLPLKIYIKTAIPIWGMVIKVKNLKKPNKITKGNIYVYMCIYIYKYTYMHTS